MTKRRGFPDGKMITTTVCLPEKVITRLEAARDDLRRKHPGMRVSVSDVMREAILHGIEDGEIE